MKRILPNLIMALLALGAFSQKVFANVIDWERLERLSNEVVLDSEGNLVGSSNFDQLIAIMRAVESSASDLVLSAEQLDILRTAAWAIDKIMEKNKQLKDITSAQLSCKIFIVTVQRATPDIVFHTPPTYCGVLGDILRDPGIKIDEGEMRESLALIQSLRSSNENPCDSAIRANINVWHHCAMDGDYSKILTMPSVMDEINSLSAGDKIRAVDLLIHAGGVYSVYGVHLYNSIEGKQGCVASSDGVDVQECPKAAALALSIRDWSGGPGNPVLILDKMGIVDDPTAPASVTRAVFPPPLVPGWSEQYEPERWAAAIAAKDPVTLATPIVLTAAMFQAPRDTTTINGIALHAQNSAPNDMTYAYESRISQICEIVVTPFWSSQQYCIRPEEVLVPAYAADNTSGALPYLPPPEEQLYRMPWYGRLFIIYSILAVFVAGFGTLWRWRRSKVR